jgi:16S rRNA processing protein RimM
VNLLEVGRVGKPHGLRGEVVVTLTTTEDERVAPGSRLVAGERPLVVVASRSHQGKWIVAFDGLTRREDADAIVGSVLRAEPLERDPEEDDEWWVHEMVGAEVVEVDGTPRGTVEALQENPASDLLVLASGALVPLRFLVGRDPEGRLVVDVPAGLFELADEGGTPP